MWPYDKLVRVIVVGLTASEGRDSQGKPNLNAERLHCGAKPFTNAVLPNSGRSRLNLESSRCVGIRAWRRRREFSTMSRGYLGVFGSSCFVKVEGGSSGSFRYRDKACKCGVRGYLIKSSRVAPITL